eukprot:s395_g47.t1
MPTAIWGSRFRSSSAHCDVALAVGVRQCPLRSGARDSGPAVPSGIWGSPLGSGNAHCDLEPAGGGGRRRGQRRGRRRGGEDDGEDDGEHDRRVKSGSALCEQCPLRSGAGEEEEEKDEKIEGMTSDEI